MSTSHIVWREVSWIPLASFTGDTWLEQHFSVMETFSADSDDVYVSEIVLFSLSVSAIDVSTVS